MQIFVIRVLVLTSTWLFSSSLFLSAARSSSLQSMHTLAMSTNGFGDSITYEGGEDSEADDAFGKPIGPMPSVSSRINFGDETPRNIQHDLWIVGAGTLGELVAKQYKDKHPDAKIIAETATTNRHATYTNMGVGCRLRAGRGKEDERTARNLIIALPPSSVEDYSAELAEACRVWAGPLGGGQMVFTSSVAVYGESDGNTVTETFRLDTRSSRSTKLIFAEESILLREGVVVRLAGLYNEHRGPHTFWLKQAKEGAKLESSADGIVNLIHYEDAASLVIKILEATVGWKEKIFLGADDEPITREEICSSALASKLFPDAPKPQFAYPLGPVGKRVDASWTKRSLPWAPRYPSFRRYMRELGGEVLPSLEEEKKQKEKGGKAETGGLWLPGDDFDPFA